MKTIIKMLPAVLALLAAITLADEGPMPQPTVPKAFEPLKRLLGTWEGVNKMGDQEMPMKVSYALTSAGTAITETLMQGTPQEMVSVYHKEGDSVAMTHYCILGNQPHMKMTKSGKTEMAFQMQQPLGLSSEREPHMHAVTLKLIDDNTLEQRWVHYVDGKEDSTTVFTFHRKS